MIWGYHYFRKHPFTNSLNLTGLNWFGLPEGIYLNSAPSPFFSDGTWKMWLEYQLISLVEILGIWRPFHELRDLFTIKQLLGGLVCTSCCSFFVFAVWMKRSHSGKGEQKTENIILHPQILLWKLIVSTHGSPLSNCDFWLGSLSPLRHHFTLISYTCAFNKSIHWWVGAGIEVVFQNSHIPK